MKTLEIFTVALCVVSVFSYRVLAQDATDVTDNSNSITSEVPSNSSMDTTTPVDTTAAGENATTSAPAETTTPGENITTAIPAETTTPGENITTAIPVKTTTPGENITTVAPVKTTTPGENITTVAPVKTTTPGENITTAAPVKTTTPGENVTTAATTETTTTQEPSTVAPPTPTPTATDTKYAVNGSNHACIIASMKITLNIQYNLTNGTAVTQKYGLNNATVDETKSSNCSSPGNDSMEQMVIVFGGNGNSLTFMFNRKDDKQYSLTQVFFDTSNVQDLFPDAAPAQPMNLLYNGSLFETSNDKSYLCTADTPVPLSGKDREDSGSSITFTNLQVQAFRNGIDDKYDTATECVADDYVSDIVPIAVGCALAGLVVIVLIAYLVGRRQKRQRGYESV